MLPNYKVVDEFRCYNLSIENNLFEELLASVQFEDVGKGRQGNVLVKPDRAGDIPLVRTTSKYNNPAYCFQPVHLDLARQIQNEASLSLDFNNALIEHYTNAYTKMGFHSDQALDLKAGSYIALFSCYKYTEENSSRKLIVESKSDDYAFEISLIHNSVVVFSLDTNRRFKHKIVLDKSVSKPKNEWLGITFRTSKTLIQFRNKKAYFQDDTAMTLANEDQKQEFYSLRGRENRENDFIYPEITYTISQSDIIPPKLF